MPIRVCAGREGTPSERSDVDEPIWDTVERLSPNDSLNLVARFAGRVVNHEIGFPRARFGQLHKNAAVGTHRLDLFDDVAMLAKNGFSRGARRKLLAWDAVPLPSNGSRCTRRSLLRGRGRERERQRPLVDAKVPPAMPPSHVSRPCGIRPDQARPEFGVRLSARRPALVILLI